jgi:hypothetical protein
MKWKNLLTVWIKDQNQRQISITLKTIQKNLESPYAHLKEKKGETEVSFDVTHAWFNCFRNREYLQHVKVSGEAVSADTAAAEEFPNLFSVIIEESGYLPEQVSNVR